MSLLDPEQRTIYGEMLAPPDGYRFDCGIGTTFSLSLATLLSIPLRLTLFGIDDGEKLLENRIALLEAIQRTAGRLTLYCQKGRISSERISALGALLEPMVQEVMLDNGVLHAKIWLLRYRSIDEHSKNRPVLLRLCIPSRNVTLDRCWDTTLVLDGLPTGRIRASNRPLIDLLSWLDKHSPRMDGDRKEQLAQIQDEAGRTEWELPEGIESLEFAVTGVGKKIKNWPLLPGARRVAVISPFVRKEALDQIADNAPNAQLSVIGRANELAALPTNLGAAKRWNPYILHQGLFDDLADGESLTSPAGADGELHAKIYLGDYAAGRGGNLAVVVGSANATNAALIRQANIEVMARLTGRQGLVGNIDRILGKESLGKYLRPFEWPAAQVVDNNLAGELALEAACAAIVNTTWKLAFEPTGDKEWEPVLSSHGKVDLPDNVMCTIRLATAPEIRAISLAKEVGSTTLSACSTADATSFVAFKLELERLDAARLILNLPDVQLPRGRDAAVMRSVISNSNAFLAYLRFLLGDVGGAEAFDELIRSTTNEGNDLVTNVTSVPLLEDLIRAMAHAPERMTAIQRLMEQVEKNAELHDVVPAGFSALWAIIAPLIEGAALK